MVVVVTKPDRTWPAHYPQGHAHSVSEHGDLIITDGNGTIVGVHNRTQWESIRYIEPNESNESK